MNRPMQRIVLKLYELLGRYIRLAKKDGVIPSSANAVWIRDDFTGEIIVFGHTVEDAREALDGLAVNDQGEAQTVVKRRVLPPVPN